MKANPAWMIYGTAWKKERTTALVEMAVHAGIRAIDTANQAKHYSEALVGEALLTLAKAGVTRDQLFLQTKFTSIDGQDSRLPYDPKANLTTQVHQSFQSSLQHLHTDYLDSYLLHGPYNHPHLGEEDWEVWAAFEALFQEGNVKRIGISNVNAHQLQELVTKARVKPMVVQNRCYANQGWDHAVRKICRDHQIMYQGFSLLTANPYVFDLPEVTKMATRLKATAEQVVFRFAIQAGMVPLTGTTNVEHLRLDLQVADLELTASEVAYIELAAVR